MLSLLFTKIIAFLPTYTVSDILRKSYRILYPYPEKLTLHGSGSIFNSCKLMMDYGDINHISIDEDCEVRLLVKNKGEDEVVVFNDGLAVLLYVAKISNCLPSDHTEVCHIIQYLQSISKQSIPDIISKFREDSEWACGYSQPSVIDFFLMTNISAEQAKDKEDIKSYAFDLFFYLDSPCPDIFDDESKEPYEKEHDAAEENNVKKYL